jgi:hypothetical protein
MTSAVQRTRAWLKEQPGWLFDTTERFVQTPNGGFRKDLFGFADLVALEWPIPEGGGLIAIQVCQGSDFAKHKTKILHDPNVRPNAIRWILAGCEIWIIGWRKLKKRGDDNKFWQKRVEMIRILDFGNREELLEEVQRHVDEMKENGKVSVRTPVRTPKSPPRGTSGSAAKEKQVHTSLRAGVRPLPSPELPF